MVIRRKIVGYIITQLEVANSDDGESINLYCYPIVPNENNDCDIDIGLDKNEKVIGLLPTTGDYIVLAKMPDESIILLGYELDNIKTTNELLEKHDILIEEWNNKYGKTD